MAQGELGLAEAVRSGLGGMVRLGEIQHLLKLTLTLSRSLTRAEPCIQQVRDLGMLGALLPPRALRQDLAVLRDSASPTDVQQGAPARLLASRARATRALPYP